MLTILMIFASILVASANLEYYENYCKDVQCPSEPIDCPNDSIMILRDFNYDNDDDSSNNDNDNDNDNDDEIEPFVQNFRNKRSLKYRPREIIKIVPSGNRNFEDEFFKYHYQYQSHHNWKRDLSDILKSNIKMCCPKLKCICKNCSIPKCQYADEYAIEISEGNNQPGNCCPKYQCTKEIDCSSLNNGNKLRKYYWLNNCTRCSCHGKLKICEDVCNSEERNNFEGSNGCFSKYNRRHYENFDSWKESDDDCTECTCSFGVSRCRSSFCKPLTCSNQIKVPGKCCKICAKDENTIVETTKIIPTTTSVATSSTESSTKSNSPTILTDSTSKSTISTTSTTTQSNTSDKIFVSSDQTTVESSTLTSTEISSSTTSLLAETIETKTKLNSSSVSITTELSIIESSSLPSSTNEYSTTESSYEKKNFTELSSTPSSIYLSSTTLKSTNISPTISLTIQPTHINNKNSFKNLLSPNSSVSPILSTTSPTPSSSSSSSASEIPLPSSETNQPLLKPNLTTEEINLFNDNDRTFLYIGIIGLLICLTAFIFLIIIKLNKKKRYLSIPSDPSLSQSSTSTLSV